MNTDKKYFRLFATCIPVKGYERSAICDIHRCNVEFIPNSLYEIITNNENKTYSELIEIFGAEQKQVIDEYFEFLLEKEFGYFFNKDELELFPKLNLQWDFYSDVSNAIIDLKEYSNYDIKEAIKQLDDIDCFHLQIRFFLKTQKEKIIELLELINETSIRSVQVMLSFNTLNNTDEYIQLCKDYLKISKIECYNSRKSEIIDVFGNLSQVLLNGKKIKDETTCGMVDVGYFSPNTPHFTESQHHNTCLNRKISIDANGKIKNCPSMQKSFGNIKNTTLKEALGKPGFKDLWSIRKDDIDVCKDCEFRYICTDCRAYLKDPSNIYSQPAKCLYNPYIAKWEGEEGYIKVEDWRKQNPDWEKGLKREPLVKKIQLVQ
ncbi:MAG: grasp-with-spasm system SPASM domain peptide maturase [Bacteroidales bacterium]|nr:grasp-with-spasm system SPASM domain peptide maturase [Bacteroidales bacterium]